MKKLRKEVSEGAPGGGGITYLIDSLMYTMYNITPSELDIICECASDEEMDAFVLTESSKFCDIKKGLDVRNKYVPYYQNKYL